MYVNRHEFWSQTHHSCLTNKNLSGNKEKDASQDEI